MVQLGSGPVKPMAKDDGSFERRPVETGRGSDRFIEITSGLRPGEAVAVRGATGLQTAFASVR